MDEVSDLDVVVGRIGKPHGVKGEVSVEVRTDEPDRRFAPGAVLSTSSPGGGVPPSAPARPGRPESLTVAAAREHQSRLLVTFAELGTRDQAEAARGLLLHVRVDPDDAPDDPEEFYDHQLVGAAVVTAEGRPVGTLVEVVHGSAQDLLSVRDEDGREILVPFVAALVPVVDVPGRRVVVEDRPGLLTPAVEDTEGGA